jgi:hypothetical protein
MQVLAFTASLQLIDAGRTSRRTIADALDILRAHPRFSERMQAEVRVRPWQLPSGTWTASIQLVCATQGFAVSLPSSTHFYGIRSRAFGPERFEIARLHGAIVDADCNVTLQCGVHLHNVRVVPTFIPPKLTYDEERIVVWTIRHFHPRKRCFRYWPNVQVNRPLRVKGVGGRLDYSTLPALKLPSLKQIVNYLRDMPGFGNYSPQTIASALARSGMRPRRSRRRRKATLTAFHHI